MFSCFRKKKKKLKGPAPLESPKRAAAKQVGYTDLFLIVKQK